MRTNKWKRVLAVGCSHGQYANQRALAAVLAMVERWKPVHRIHLGDAFDCTFLMASKLKSGDCDKPQADIAAGQKFLHQFKPTVFCMGNHEDRASDLVHSHNALVATAADAMLKQMLSPLDKTGCKIIPYTVHANGWHNLGGYKWGHGHLYGEQYLRDTAEAWGNCVVAHAHRPGVAPARRSDHAKAYGVGCLCDVERMEYADRRRSTLAWGYGMVFGEICQNQAQLSLWEWPQDATEFRLPI